MIDPCIVQVFAVDVINVTADRETGEFLATKLNAVVDKVEKVYGVQVHAITSDAPNCKKARRLVVSKRQGISSNDYVAHKASLITGDFFKVGVRRTVVWQESFRSSFSFQDIWNFSPISNSYTTFVESVVTIMTWFIGHLSAHDKLKMKANEVLGRTVTLQLPVSTRWGSMVDAISILL